MDLGSVLEPTSIPPSFVSKGFLEQTLNRKVSTFKISSGSNPGDGYLAAIFGLQVVFKGDDDRDSDEKQQHFILKCHPPQPGLRQFSAKTKMFEKELMFYRDFVPQLEQLARKNGLIGVELDSCWVPPFHGGNVASESSSGKPNNDTLWSSESLILLTDLRPLGYKMRDDRLAGLDLPHGILAVKELAKLHALAWAYKKKKREEGSTSTTTLLTSRYPYFRDFIYYSPQAKKEEEVDFSADKYRRNVLKAVELQIGSSHPAYASFHKFLLNSDDEDVAVANQMWRFVAPAGIDEQFVEGLLRVKEEMDDSFVKEPWLVATHGDFWMNNLLFRYDSAGNPDKVSLVDFQMCREACPSLDLAYLFLTSLRAESRALLKPKLLEIYYESFLGFCGALGVEPLPGFSFPTLQRRLRRAGLYALLVSTIGLNVALKTQEDDWTPELEEGKGEEGRDDGYGPFSSIYSGTYRNPLFRKEMSAVVLECWENGII